MPARLWPLVAVAVAAVALLSTGQPAQAQSSLVHFTSPSRNIDCILASGGGPPAFASCLVERASWRGPARPASCDLEWVRTELSLEGRRTRVGACRGDVGPLCVRGTDPCRVLAYGASVTRGGIRCRSTKAGMTCRRVDGRRQGFLVARERFLLYR